MRRDDYNEKLVQASRSVMVELMTVLGAYRKEILLVGGWCPQFLTLPPEDPVMQHCGSLDVDLGLSPKCFSKDHYASIGESLVGAGYSQVKSDHPFQWERVLDLVTVRVDLMTGEYGGQDSHAMFKTIQDTEAIKTVGCDLAFEIGPVEVKLEGLLPDGSVNSVDLPVVAAVPFLVMKARALRDRMKLKDAYDIWYVLRYYRGGIDALVKEFIQHRHRTVVRSALEIIREKYARLDSIGPSWTASFDSTISFELQQQRRQDVFQRVAYILDAVLAA